MLSEPQRLRPEEVFRHRIRSGWLLCASLPLSLDLKAEGPCWAWSPVLSLVSHWPKQWELPLVEWLCLPFGAHFLDFLFVNLDWFGGRERSSTLML